MRSVVHCDATYERPGVRVCRLYGAREQLETARHVKQPGYRCLLPL